MCSGLAEVERTLKEEGKLTFPLNERWSVSLQMNQVKSIASIILMIRERTISMIQLGLAFFCVPRRLGENSMILAIFGLGCSGGG